MRNGIILSVDDEPINRKLMKAMLAPEGYEIVDAPSGEEAIEAVFRFSPDLILMDVMMPGMNGFDVCKRLKNDDQTKAIPIIMVTGLRDKAHQLSAMEAGADDFVSKPVDRFELLIRVKSLLRIKRYHDELLCSYTQIDQKNKKLEELEQMKEGLIHMIIHDLRNPLTAISGLIEISLLDRSRFDEGQIHNFEKCGAYCNEMSEQIENLLSIHLMENTMLPIQAEPTDIASLLDASLEQVGAAAEKKGISLFCSVPADIPPVSLDARLIKRVMTNLLSNAIRHTPSGGRVESRVKFRAEGRKVQIAVKDTGNGLAPEHHQRVFDKFEQVKLKNEGVYVGSSGLGLAFCKIAVEAHGGRIWVESEGEGKGCTFTFEIPPGGKEESCRAGDSLDA
jgi:two-component system sensor histidine kinase/response regulator